LICQIFAKGLLETKIPSCIIAVKVSIEDARNKCKRSKDLVKYKAVTGYFLNNGQVFDTEMAIDNLLKEAGVPINSIKCMKYKASRDQ
jgi:hypothetical protein